MKRILANILVIGLSAALLWNFSNIWRYGRYLVGEPNLLVRSMETIGLVAILIFGIVAFVDTLRRGD